MTSLPTSVSPVTSRLLRRDLRTLMVFVETYCRAQHRGAAREQLSMRGMDVSAIRGRPVRLCAPCAKLLAHALIKRLHCPLDPKPACKHCPNHCYHPTYRAAIRQVMRCSGRAMVLRGRLDYLVHLFS
jgi:hypothetical protein